MALEDGGLIAGLRKDYFALGVFVACVVLALGRLVVGGPLRWNDWAVLFSLLITGSISLWRWIRLRRPRSKMK